MKKGKSIFIILLFAVTILVLVAVIYLINNPSTVSDIREKLATTKTEEYSSPYEIMTNTDIASDTNSYINMSIVLATNDKDTAEYIASAQIPVREILVRYINANPASIWTDSEKIEKAKSELIKQLNQELELEISGLYITDIVRQ